MMRYFTEHVAAMPKRANTLVVLPYDPHWVIAFERIRDYLIEHIGDLVLEIQHVGSTSVPGLCAKPIIDIVAIMESYEAFPGIVARLEALGYVHVGDQGIKEREVFKRLIPDDFMDYHFYVCPKDSEESRRQNIFRNALLNNKYIADEYGKLKLRLIEEVNGDRVLYTDSKTDFIVGVINKAIKDNAFWVALDKLVSESKLVIDRPKDSHHPKYPTFVYPVDYGYLENTTSMDGGGIDVWKGTDGDVIDAIICTVDLMKKDSEIKILIGCSEDEKQLVLDAHNNSEYMKGIMIRRDAE